MALTDRANHFKNLYESSMKEMKSTVQSFEDQRASNDAARESLEEQLKEVSHEHRLCQQKLQGCEGRNRVMALKVKEAQETVRVTEERALESEALHIAVAERLQCAEEEVARLRIAAAQGPVRVEDSTQTEAASTVDPQMVQEKVAEVASVVLVRGEVYTQTDSVVVDHTSNGVVAESEVDLAKEICEARKEVSTLERQNERLHEFLTDITDDYRLMTRGKAPVNGARACGFCRALIAANRSQCFGCGQPAPGTEGYQRARSATKLLKAV